MNKRISSRAIIIDNNELLVMFRRKIKDNEIKEYYAIPGGGKEENETLEENVIRELKEEFSVNIKILGYLGKKEYDNAIEHFFNCSIISGTPTLGGEELERNTKENYYEVRKISIDEALNSNINAKDMILSAINQKYTNIKG